MTAQTIADVVRLCHMVSANVGSGVMPPEQGERITLFGAAPLLLAALEKVEWSVPLIGAHGCPSCFEWEHEGHKADCTLAAALRAARPRSK